jgi:hypothetical protein
VISVKWVELALEGVSLPSPDIFKNGRFLWYAQSLKREIAELQKENAKQNI